ncbi:MAG TPA: hypothetical protein DDW73_00685 [Rhizobium sp.]|jgi:cellulose synthase/poly-beta-1,6-N-acetylglucosamine synthase-like glycosyltransferase|nr:hypothetical protein [Rhizobium sp.]
MLKIICNHTWYKLKIYPGLFFMPKLFFSSRRRFPAHGLRHFVALISLLSTGFLLFIFLMIILTGGAGAFDYTDASGAYGTQDSNSKEREPLKTSADSGPFLCAPAADHALRVAQSKRANLQDVPWVFAADATNSDVTPQQTARSQHEMLLSGNSKVESRYSQALSGACSHDRVRGRGPRIIQAGFFPALPEKSAWFARLAERIFICLTAIGTVRPLIVSALAIYASYSGRLSFGAVTGKKDADEFVATTFVSVLVPAYNEAKVIEASVRRLLESTGVSLEVIVIDDGSKDGTAAVVERFFAHDPRVRLIVQDNGGKASALNHGLAMSRGEIIVALDADTQFEPDTVSRLVSWFVCENIGAVAGNTKVGNCHNAVTLWQTVEYVTSQNLERVAFSSLGAMMVVPGAAGAWRRDALLEVGGYPEDTLAEDQDVTIALHSAGWKVIYDPEAVAWTEAPETFRDLIKQRLRWAYGTVQCLLKYRSLCFSRKAPGIAWIGLPQAWFFQIAFAIISPLIDVIMICSLVFSGISFFREEYLMPWLLPDKVLFCFATMLLIEIICGSIAYRLEPREQRLQTLPFLAQRFVYRQSMYLVVLKSLYMRFRTLPMGWGKLQRSGISVRPDLL